MRVGKGVFMPADVHAQQRLKDKNFRMGEVVGVQVRRMREYWYHKMVHAFGDLVAQNIDDFAGMNAHEVLKRLQVEGLIGCTCIPLRTETGERVDYYVPRSLAYDEMDQAEFEEVYGAFCQLVVERYWPNLEPEQVAVLAEIMGDYIG
ncbi:Phage protein [Alloalcanivorax xenomutans]|uniref:hypothetical protein n=1 Tax=Alloalcanivorax xenomutans TaxID=1094342 RepID=UPI0006D5C4A1|nr:hypothetical protein [Alloalcanivorax xenomutans]CUR48470.1 Phage protein [Alloalcanivorax xenomutans]